MGRYFFFFIFINDYTHQGKLLNDQSEDILRKNYEVAQKRIVALETDLRLAEQRVVALEKVQKEGDNGEIKILREQLCQKSELLDKVKYLLSRVAVNEKTLRQRVNIHFYVCIKKRKKHRNNNIRNVHNFRYSN